ncbi:hypothetical protein HKX48_006340, partial [Thoreauomyces humboldtii]
MKADGALKTGDLHKAAKASSEMDHHGIHRSGDDHVQTADASYAEGQEGHKLPAAAAAAATVSSSDEEENPVCPGAARIVRGTVTVPKKKRAREQDDSDDDEDVAPPPA